MRTALLIPALLCACAPSQVVVRDVVSGHVVAVSNETSVAGSRRISLTPSGPLGAVRLRGGRCEVEVGDDARLYVSRDCRVRWNDDRVCFDDALFVDLLAEAAGHPKMLKFSGCTGIESEATVGAEPRTASLDGEEAAERWVRYDVVPDVEHASVCFELHLKEGCELSFAAISDPDPHAFAYSEAGGWRICHPHDWCADPGLRFEVADTCGHRSSSVISVSGFSLRACAAHREQTGDDGPTAPALPSAEPDAPTRPASELSVSA